ncbi:MAG: YwaF family protein [Erysipelotrichaceae bacterium]|nr:YwaF family protein [Erysipelotrichaceae bacterium]
MFTVRHFIWIAICVILCAAFIWLYFQKRPSLHQVLIYCCGVCVASEFVKVFSVIRMVPSTNGAIIYPYIEMNHLPLHLCSIQIPLIFYVCFTSNKKMRENVLAFMYPSCLLGAIAAILMPSIFRTSVPVEKAFIHPLAYQTFIYHAMLIVLAVCIAASGEIHWQKKHLKATLLIAFLAGFLSLYVNSLLASPTYVDGKLVAVDFWPNFMFTYDNPLGIKMTEIWHWYLYLVILSAVVVILVSILYIPLLRKKKN